MIPGALNRLQHEKSPYLLQHVENPVDWHTWEEEGRFYLWRTDEIRRRLDPEEARFAVEIFGLEEGEISRTPCLEMNHKKRRGALPPGVSMLYSRECLATSRRRLSRALLPWRKDSHRSVWCR